MNLISHEHASTHTYTHTNAYVQVGVCTQSCDSRSGFQLRSQPTIAKMSFVRRHKHTYICKNIVLCTSASSCVCIIYLLYFFFLLFACLIQISCIEIIENTLFMLSAFSFTFPLCCRSHWYMHRIFAATIRNVYGSPTMLLLLLLQRRIVIAVSIISLVFACQSIFTTH